MYSTRDGRDDGGGPEHERVQKGGLARVRAPEDRALHACPQTLAATRIAQVRVQRSHLHLHYKCYK